MQEHNAGFGSTFKESSLATQNIIAPVVMADLGPKLRLYGTGTRAVKAELVAVLAGVAIEKPPFTFGVTNRTPRYLSWNPTGKVRPSTSAHSHIERTNIMHCIVIPLLSVGLLYESKRRP